MEQALPRLHTGTRVGEEFKSAWEYLKGEAEAAAALLGEEVEGPLATDINSAGDGSISGETRSQIVEQRERQMGRVLLEGLSTFTNQSARPVWSWPERDKLSSQWLLALPGHNSSLTSEEFSEAIAALLCLPSPTCATKVGERVGRSIVDKYGDSVMAAALQGDGWRKRHDCVKMRIFGLLRWAGVEVDCEVFNLFSGLIPQQGLSRLERGRKRQGLVPDFRLRVPVADGRRDGGQLVLAELKIISSCPTRYQRNPRAATKAVDRRAATLPGEYVKHARSIDQEYGGVPDGTVGPVEAKLLSFPLLRRWVFGAWGEASEDVHLLVHDLATARLQHVQVMEGRRRWDRRSEEGELAILTGQVRRWLSLEGVRSQARCLLDRVAGLGLGAAAAAKRRGWALFEEARMSRERNAHQLCLSQGHYSLRRGRFLL